MNNNGGALSFILLIVLVIGMFSVLKGDCNAPKYKDCDKKGNCW